MLVRLETKLAPMVPAIGTGPIAAKLPVYRPKRALKWSKILLRRRAETFLLHFASRFPYNLRLLEALSSFLRFRILTDWGWYE
jgi:hypothetical protein